MSLRCSVLVRIEGLSDAESGAIIDALRPDNVDMPSGLDIDIRTEDDGDAAGGGQDGKPRVLIIECVDDAGRRGTEPARVMGHIIGTVDEMLEHVQVSQKVMIRDA